MSGDKQFQNTFARRKNDSKSSTNGQKREKERGKGKNVKVEVKEEAVVDESRSVEEDLVVPSSSVESRGKKDDEEARSRDSDRKLAHKLMENGGVGSSSVSKSATQKRKSDGGGNDVKKKKQKSHKEEKLKKEGELKVKPKQKQEESKKKGNAGKERDLLKMKVEENGEKKKKKNDEDDEEPSAGCRFPVARVDRIIRSEGPDYRITHEAVFLINKATEKFLEILCEDSYECAAHSSKNYVSYNNLSTVVSKEKRLDFLSDYVPEKVKAEKALAERQPVVK